MNRAFWYGAIGGSASSQILWLTVSYGLSKLDGLSLFFGVPIPDPEAKPFYKQIDREFVKWTMGLGALSFVLGGASASVAYGLGRTVPRLIRRPATAAKEIGK